MVASQRDRGAAAARLGRGLSGMSAIRHWATALLYGLWCASPLAPHIYPCHPSYLPPKPPRVRDPDCLQTVPEVQVIDWPRRSGNSAVETEQRFLVFCIVRMNPLCYLVCEQEKTPFTEELETYQYVVPINVGDAMSGGDPMGDVAFDVTEYIYHSTAVTIYICIVVFLLFVVIGIGAIMIFKKKVVY